MLLKIIHLDMRAKVVIKTLEEFITFFVNTIHLLYVKLKIFPCTRNLV